MFSDAIQPPSWGVVALSTVGAVLFVNYISLRQKRKGLPPGPTPLPMLGSALALLGRPLHVTFANLQKQYGDIFCIRVADKEVVVINGFKNIKEALVSQGRKFNGRPNITWTSITSKQGIFSTDGELYHQQKGVIRSILTAVDWDKSDVAEERIVKSSTDLVEWLSQIEGKPVDPQIYLDTAVCNVNSIPVMGVAFKPTDELMIAVSKIAMDIFIDAGAQNINNYFTFLRSFPGDPTNYQVLVNNAVTAMGVIEGVISNHKEKLEKSPESKRTDFIDHYLDEMKKESPNCTEGQLTAIVTDLVAMGIEATSTTMRWALLLLSQHPDVQLKIQEEIDAVIGSSTVGLKYKNEMSYTNAFITEVQRYVNLVSINLPHATTEPVTFNGYQIPEGTIIIANAASVHYDEQAYPEPFKFNPQRFLDKEGYQAPEKFMPYSMGTRMCLGKNLSQWQLFLLLTSILQRFNVKLSGNAVNPDVYGLIRYPAAFSVIFSDRSREEDH